MAQPGYVPGAFPCALQHIVRVLRFDMLELRPNCECCDKDLPPDAADAMICTYECTFCRDCVETRLKGVCPNCGGNLTPRPIRPANKLVKDPPSGKRVFKPECADNTAT